MPEEKNKETTQHIQPRSITQEMKESYIDYAMSVIVSRALPDVRDGLKPVQRRILYAMYEMGLRHDAKFRKSATVTGNVLGRYHPHGDAPVYGALARMTQDFSLRYPLIAGQGNWGSIDDPTEVAAMRYCITGDSLIITNRCLERIGEISDKEDISLKVLSFGKKINSASKWFDSGIHPILKIKTLKGYELEGTFNHPILTIQKGIQGQPIFQWKLLGDIKNGDFTVIDRSEVLWPKKEPYLKQYFPKIAAGNYQRIIHKLPSHLSPDLAFLLGAVVAEGYISTNKKKGSYKIGFCNTDKEFIDGFQTRFEKVFPTCPIYKLKRKPVGWGKKNFVSFEICSGHLVEFFKNLGLVEVPAKQKRVPQIIFHGTKESAGEFLKGYFEGDGGTYKNISSCWVECSSSSKKLVKEIQILLLRFGIVSSANYNPKRKEFKLIVRGHENLNRFKEKINFLTKKNKNRLQKFSQINSDGKVMSKTDYVPFLGQYLRGKCKERYKKNEIKQEVKHWLLSHNLNRYPKLQKYYHHLKKILDRSDIELINNFLQKNNFFDPVVSIQKKGQKRVYSLRVDSSCHTFISNGFISHNTECKLSKIGEELLKDIERDTVDFIANFDGTRKEPIVFPSPLPNLLLNGCLGIAVAVATNIPPHNLSELCDACIYLVDHPGAGLEEVFKFIQGPDFPTGGIIYDKDAIFTAYSQGKGSIRMRGKAEIKEVRGGARIIISEIPFGIQKSGLVQQIAKLVQDKKIQGIIDVRDESDREGIRVVVDLRQDSQPQRILNFLFRWTSLQTSFHMNMIALIDGIQPKRLNLAEMLREFLGHRTKVVIRRTKFDLRKAKERCHILEGFHKALKNIDAIIKTIKASKDRPDAEKNLIKKFKLTKIQANAILDMKLASLAKMERQKIEDELSQTKEKIKELTTILKSPIKIKNIIKKELEESKKIYGDERRTKIVSRKVGEMSFEDLVPQEPAVITLTQKGYIKRVKPSVLRLQKRGGKGMLGQKTSGEDVVEHLIFANTHDNLLFFTDSGKVFQTRVFEVPEAKRISRGKSLLNFLDIGSQEKVLALLPLPKNEQERTSALALRARTPYLSRNLKNSEIINCFVMATKKGIIKKTAISEFENVRRTGLIAINLKKGDLLKEVRKSRGEDDIILVTKKGKAIKFKEKDVRPMGRTAAGVKGIRLAKTDEIIGMEIIKNQKSNIKNQKENRNYLLVVSENGYGKRTPLQEYRLQKRGGSGIKTANITKKTGELVACKVLNGSEEHLMAISQHGHVIKMTISGISKIGRATQGVRIMRLGEQDKVASIAVI